MKKTLITAALLAGTSALALASSYVPLTNVSNSKFEQNSSLQKTSPSKGSWSDMGWPKIDSKYAHLTGGRLTDYKSKLYLSVVNDGQTPETMNFGISSYNGSAWKTTKSSSVTSFLKTKDGSLIKTEATPNYVTRTFKLVIKNITSNKTIISINKTDFAGKPTLRNHYLYIPLEKNIEVIDLKTNKKKTTINYPVSMQNANGDLNSKITDFKMMANSTSHFVYISYQLLPSYTTHLMGYDTKTKQWESISAGNGKTVSQGSSFQMIGKSIYFESENGISSWDGNSFNQIIGTPNAAISGYFASNSKGQIFLPACTYTTSGKLISCHIDKTNVNVPNSNWTKIANPKGVKINNDWASNKSRKYRFPIQATDNELYAQGKTIATATKPSHPVILKYKL